MRTPPKWPKQAGTLAKNPHFWAITLMVAICTVFHYPDQLGLSDSSSGDYLWGLQRHSVDRIFYLVPIIYAGYIFGATAGLALTAVSLFAMLPRILFISTTPTDAVFETGAVVLVGILANFWFRARARQMKAMREREQSTASMFTAQEKLRSQIRNTMRYQQKLTTLSKLSSLLAQSLEMDRLQRMAIDLVVEVMGVEVVLLFILEDKTGELVVMDFEGVSPEFARLVDRIKVGEGFNGWVAQTGEPLLVDDVSQDPRLTREVVKRENIQAQLIVPMKARGKIVGTLCVATHQHREFDFEEIELLTAIANEIGIAIDNARLYQEQLTIAEQLRQSETNYRELFDSAHDAIWVHDMEGNIQMVNKAGEVLFNSTAEKLSKMNIKDLLPTESLKNAMEVGYKLFHGQTVTQPYEQHFIQRDGTETTLMLTTNLLSSGDHPKGFQNIARDITEEKRMQENLRFYVQQITRAQEEERLRIAHELHDSTAQSLIALLHQLENLLHDKSELPLGEAREMWAFHEQIKDVLQEVRHITRGLRPSILDDLGLIPALHWLTRQLQTEQRVETSLQIHGAERRFSQEAELILFRIVQEGLRNIGRHAHASKAEVSITFGDGKTTVVITDNGIGFNLPAEVSDLSRIGKLGLTGMQERVRLLDGRLEAKSEEGKGTIITIKAPI
ncbi:MAG: GAF domain-containing protein [Dehalococcoidia bacterium]|nr:GAF domain-containing protein [Dehalococcoidia bacterium]